MDKATQHSEAWHRTTAHCGCIYPCSGHPVLRKQKQAVPLAADVLPIWLQCSECGYAPLPDEQPELVKRWLQHHVDNLAGEKKNG